MQIATKSANKIRIYKGGRYEQRILSGLRPFAGQPRDVMLLLWMADRIDHLAYRGFDQDEEKDLLYILADEVYSELARSA